MIEHKTSDWWRGLSKIQYAINTSWSRSIQRTPYKAVFGQHPLNWTTEPNDEEVQTLLEDAKKDLNEFECCVPPAADRRVNAHDDEQQAGPSVVVNMQVVHEECIVCNLSIDDTRLTCANCSTICHVEN
jgi:hypothetical protein